MFANILFCCVYAYLIWWILKLERIGCKCSESWRRDFIKWWMMIFILFTIVIFIQTSMQVKIPLIVSIGLAVVLTIMHLIFITLTWQYTSMLKKTKCACADGNERFVLEVFNYIQIGLVALALVIGIVYIPTALAMIKGTSGKSKSKK